MRVPARLPTCPQRHLSVTSPCFKTPPHFSSPVPLPLTHPPPLVTFPHRTLVWLRADLRFEVTARRSDSSATRRGIYLRDPQDARHPMTFQ